MLSADTSSPSRASIAGGGPQATAVGPASTATPPNPARTLEVEDRWRCVTDAAFEVVPALFFSLLISTLSFIPVFTLQAQEGRLFGPLAYTKTYAMAAAALLSATLIPVLMGWWIMCVDYTQLFYVVSRMVDGVVFFFKQKTAYEI